MLFASGLLTATSDVTLGYRLSGIAKILEVPPWLIGLLLHIFSVLDASFLARQISAGPQGHFLQKPRLAALLNLLTGGLGYLYLGKKKRAVLAYGLLVAVSLSLGVGMPFVLFLACMAIDAYAIGETEFKAVIAESAGTDPMSRSHSTVNLKILVGTACLLGVGYVGFFAPRTAREREWKAHTTAGEVAEGQGRYEDAEKDFAAAVKIAQLFGSDDLRLATSLRSLGMVYLSQAKYAEAEPHLKRALAIQEKALGQDHPDVLTSLDNLASLYLSQKKYAEAEPLYKRSLTVRHKAQGPAHPDVATILNNLALLYQGQGKSAEAEPLYKRSLTIREKALGPNHPDVAQSLNNLAWLYQTQGKYGEAELLYKRALSIHEKALGTEHPDVATDLNNLAVLYLAQRKYAEAEPLFKRALSIAEKALGSEHSDVAQSLESYAMLLRKTNRKTEAERLEARARNIRAKRHP